MFNDVMPPGRESKRSEGVKAGNSGPDPVTRALRLRLFPTRPDLCSDAGKTAKRVYTRLRFDLPERSVISVAVHNLSGRRIRLLAATVMESGRHHVQWDGCDDRGLLLPPGVYEVKVEAASENGNLYRASERTTVAP